MVVVVLTACPPKLRGHLTRWLIEISPGVYVGHVSARVRDLIWQQITENSGRGRAIMVFSANNEQRLSFRTHGQTWQPVDVEGLTLVLRPDSNQVAPSTNSSDQTTHHSTSQRKVGWSNAAKFRRYGRR